MKWLNVLLAMWVLLSLSACVPKKEVPAPQSRLEAELSINLIETLFESTGVRPEVAEMIVDTIPTLTFSTWRGLLTQ